MLTKPLLDLEVLKEAFDYNSKTGELTWKIRPANRIRIGDKAGGNVEGYSKVKLKGQTMFVHRIAWALGHNEEPPIDMVVDHIDENKSNNRLDNLRLLTIGQNSAQRTREPKCWVRNLGGYQACFTIDGVKHTLGTFKTAEEASKVGRAARREARCL